MPWRKPGLFCLAYNNGLPIACRISVTGENKVKRVILTTGVLVGALVLSAVGFTKDKPKPNPGNSNPGNKVTLCHATGSATNPFVVITVNANGAVNGHAGASHQGGRDIIPPFDYNRGGETVHFPGQNWDAQGQATLANGCEVEGQPTPTTPTTTTPTTPTETTPTTPTEPKDKPKEQPDQPRPVLPEPPSEARGQPDEFPFTP